VYSGKNISIDGKETVNLIIKKNQFSHFLNSVFKTNFIKLLYCSIRLDAIICIVFEVKLKRRGLENGFYAFLVKRA